MVKVWYSIIEIRNGLFSNIYYCYQDHLKIYELYLKYYLDRTDHFYIIKTYEHPLKFNLQTRINSIPTISIYSNSEGLMWKYIYLNEFEDFNLIEEAEQIITKRYSKIKEQYERNKTKIPKKFLCFVSYTFQTFEDYLKNIGKFSYDMSTKKCKNIINLTIPNYLNKLHETILLGPKKFYYLLRDKYKPYKISQNEDEIMEALSLIRFNNKHNTSVRLYKTYHHPQNMRYEDLRFIPHYEICFGDNILRLRSRFKEEFNPSFRLKLRTILMKLDSLCQLNKTTTEYEIFYDYAKEQEMINVIRN